MAATAPPELEDISNLIRHPLASTARSRPPRRAGGNTLQAVLKALVRFSARQPAPSRRTVARLTTLLSVITVAALGAVSTGAGALACAALLFAAAVRADATRLTWLGMATASLGWAVASLTAGRPAVSAWTHGNPIVDLGVLMFVCAAATGNLVWPELRRRPWRLAATLVETVTAMAALSLWCAYLSAKLSGAGTTVLLQSADLLLPAVTAALTAPQLTAPRRAVAWKLLAAMCLLLASRASLGAHDPATEALVVQSRILAACAFAVLAWAARASISEIEASEQVDHELPQPPFLVPGLVAISALVLVVLTRWFVWPPALVLSLVLGAALSAREALSFRARRMAGDELASSVELESRLLTVHAEAELDLDAGAALRGSCELAMEVLRANAALAWLSDGETLTLRAVCPTARSSLEGRTLSVRDDLTLATRVVWSGQPELLEASQQSAPVDRFLATVLDAGWLLGLPILWDERAIGALILVRPRGGRPFSYPDQQKGTLIAAQVASMLRRIELHEELDRQLEETSALQRFADEAINARTINDGAWLLLESLRARLAFERGSVYLADSAFRPIAHFRSRQPQAWTQAVDQEPPHRLSLSLRIGDNAIGYVEIYRRGVAFSPEEERVGHGLVQQGAMTIQTLRLQEQTGKLSLYEELDKMKTNLLNTVSHDLRGPLTNIGFAAAQVEEGHLSDQERRDYLKTIRGEAERLRELLEHLLDMSRIEAGVLTVDRRAVNLSRIVGQAFESLSLSEHVCEMAIPMDLYVMADGHRLRQVLDNLAQNAAKYSPKGGTIRVAAASRDGDVVISVSDDGVGIPRHQWETVFRPYQRADTSRGFSGNGLGLAICKGVVEAHGGRIWVESEPGVGSTFSFTLTEANLGSDVLIGAGGHALADSPLDR